MWHEPAHLNAGVRHLHTGDFSCYRVNPPLVKCLAALPLVLFRNQSRAPEIPYEMDRPEFAQGSAYASSLGVDLRKFVVLARWTCLPVSIIGAVVCCRWAFLLYGRGASLIALSLWCFSPYLLGHGSLFTTDAHCSALGLTAGFMFWRWLRHPTWERCLLAGMTLGIAELSKFTFLVLYPVWTVVWIVYACSTGPRPVSRWIRESWMLVAVFGVSLLLTNMGYGFEGSFRRLGQFPFRSHSLSGTTATLSDHNVAGNRFLGTLVEPLPVPLPLNYVLGVDTQKVDFEQGVACYLHGTWQRSGCPWYYAYAFAVKIPLGTWMLFLLAMGASCLSRSYRRSIRDEFVVIAPAVAILALVSLQTGINVHSRYAIPALPFIFVWISKVAISFKLGHRTVATAVLMGLSWSVTSSLMIYPHSLSYFNELAGGPRGGDAHLLGSNLDWGQDMHFLDRWCKAHPQTRAIHIRCYGAAPTITAIDVAGSTGGQPGSGESELSSTSPPSPGWYAISSNVLFSRDGPNKYFRNLEPEARVAYSMRVYHIPPQKW